MADGAMAETGEVGHRSIVKKFNERAGVAASASLWRPPDTLSAEQPRRVLPAATSRFWRAAGSDRVPAGLCRERNRRDREHIPLVTSIAFTAPPSGWRGAIPACPARPSTAIVANRVPRQASQTSNPVGSGTIAASAWSYRRAGQLLLAREHHAQQ